VEFLDLAPLETDLKLALVRLKPTIVGPAGGGPIGGYPNKLLSIVGYLCYRRAVREGTPPP